MRVEDTKMNAHSCVYDKGGTTDKPLLTDDGRRIHNCDMHGRCVTAGKNNEFASCERCSFMTPPDSEKLATDFVDHLLITGRDKQPTTALRNLIGPSKTAFLVAGGPSSRKLDLRYLEQRGVFSLAVNQMAAHYNASAFVCSDPPSKFSDAIWMDPTTMKFVPMPKVHAKRGKLRTKVSGQFSEKLVDGVAVTTADAPNVWGFARRSWFLPDHTFFTDNEAAWGNLDRGVRKHPQMEKTVCTLLLGLRLLYYLGARTIFLVGVDFHMDEDKGSTDNYAFKEKRDKGAIYANNNLYRVTSGWLQTMVDDGVFEKFGLSVYNTNAESHLTCFPHTTYAEAIAYALKDYPQYPFDLEGWYEK